MEQIAAAGFPESMLGFKLAGISLVAECSEKNAEERVNELFNNTEVGLVILEREILPFLQPKTRKRIEASTKPVAIVIPGKTGKKVADEESIAALIKRAIGVELKVK
jgi:vacuolar-type H+-ATPase subunit F/Vma7